MAYIEKFLKKINKKSNIFVVVICLIISGVVVLEVWIKIRDGLAKENKRIIVARRNLLQGDILTLADLDFVFENKTSLRETDIYFDDQDIPALVGRELRENIESRSPILQRSLVFNSDRTKSHSIPKGKRAFFIEASNFHWVQPGSKVDLILKPHLDNKNSLILAENVMVLSVDSENEPFGVTVALTPLEIDWIQRNSKTGPIVLAVRNPKDKGRSTALNKGKHRFPKRVKVEVITEGQ
ncbi:MAG: hypothetical protein ACKOA8_07500 [Deltaproteobacteria bacterium]